MSKYIGETEKNLRRVSKAVETGEAILFLDEADALFDKRTEVRDAHERFANIDINYLLELIEHYPGVTILATNTKSILDQAFLWVSAIWLNSHIWKKGTARVIEKQY